VTYSIVARDEATGELGVAVQSHWFSVGSVVTWARAGVGAVATQSIAEPAYGPRLLDRLEAGESPGAALEAETQADAGARVRQVAAVDSSGAVAAHTGEGCIPDAGDIQGNGFSVQANMMAAPEVWPGMAREFEASEGPLAERLLTALRAGEEAGGDVRGRQSAALLVVPGGGEPWRRTVELRVEDSPEPLEELARLLALDTAYKLMSEAEDAGTAGEYERAGELFARAYALAPDNAEFMFWGGLGLAQQELDAGAALVRQAIDRHAGWGKLLARLEVDVAPAAASVREKLGITAS
jgi:uncharacterized Ntn-hydrolase superfamily protein